MRTILAVVAGIFAWGLISVSCNQGLMAAMPGSFDDDGITTSTGILILVWVTSSISSFAAGALAAAIGRDDRLKTVRILAIVQVLIGIAVQASYGDRIPLWWNIVFIGLLYPMHILGGRFWIARAQSPT